MIKESCISNLVELQAIVRQLDDDTYAAPLEVLSQSSLGQHIRHVIEFYFCLLDNYADGVVNYDLRQRNLDLQTKVNCGIDAIDIACKRINALPDDHAFTLKGDAGVHDSKPFIIRTSLQRELAYNLEHAIHHQALIKIGLRELQFEEALDTFGVAASTLRNAN